MTQDQIEALPNEYIRKFGSFIFRATEMQREAHEEINKDQGMYQQIKNLGQIMTNEEIEANEAARQKHLVADTSYQYELEGYMKRQPRLDLKKVGNYNYE